MFTGSDAEDATRESVRPVRSNSTLSQSILGTPVSAFEDADANEDYEKQADDIVARVWRIFQDNEGWSPEAKSNNGVDFVLTKNLPKYGKFFRLNVRPINHR